VRAPSGRPQTPRVCEVWWARLSDVGPHLDRLLSDADLERRSRLAYADDRRRLTGGGALARIVLGRLVGTDPRELQVDRTCPQCGGPHGKPWLPAAPQVQFSVSHAGGCIVVAALRGGPVGVDVEQVSRLPDVEVHALAGYVLAEPERRELARQPVPERAATLTSYWVRKEAVVKATGEGLSAALQELVVSPPTVAPRLLRWTKAEGRASLSLHDLHPPAGYVSALAVAADAPTVVVERDAGPLLQGYGAGSASPVSGGQRSRVTRTSTSSVDPSPPPATTPLTGDTSP
jgi:4'-phosphopantetheinyl transferase